MNRDPQRLSRRLSPFPLLPAAVAFAAFLLSACLFGGEDDPERRTLTLTGALADLDTLPPVTPDTASGITYQSWFLPVDSTEFDKIDESGSCFYTGYLEDSSGTAYTNPLMSGQKAAQAFRSEGLELYRATTEPVYTHYRVVFDCLE